MKKSVDLPQGVREYPSNPTVDAMVERFVKGKKEQEKSMYKSGKKAGIDHVRDSSDFAQMIRLRGLYNWGHGTSEEGFYEIASEMDCDNPETIMQEFRESYGGDIDNPDWISGFIAGVAETFTPEILSRVIMTSLND